MKLSSKLSGTCLYELRPYNKGDWHTVQDKEHAPLSLKLSCSHRQVQLCNPFLPEERFPN
eukprot:1160826-Pelagomonas_calceolata.AAC.1